MGKNEFIQLEIIDITQQKNVGEISSNEHLILAEIAEKRLSAKNSTR